MDWLLRSQNFGISRMARRFILHRLMPTNGLVVFTTSFVRSVEDTFRVFRFYVYI